MVNNFSLKLIIFLPVLILFNLVLSGADKVVQKKDDEIKITEVVSADIIRLENGKTVRLIGLEIPEEIKEEARQFLKKLAEGQLVRLNYDKQKEDELKRTLVYAYLVKYGDMHLVRDLGDDFLTPGDYGFEFTNEPVGNAQMITNESSWLFLNAYIIQCGYAKPALKAPNIRFTERFHKFSEEARKNKRGLWKNDKHLLGNEDKWRGDHE